MSERTGKKRPKQCRDNCKAEPSEKPHRCPYKSEIHSDDETLCWCCDGCEYECGRDV